MAPQQRRRRRAVAALAIFATAQANTTIVQPPNLPVHSPSDVLPSVASARPIPIEYYPPPQAESTYQVKLKPLSRTATNTKPHIIKKQTKKSHIKAKNSAHEPHSPWHTAEYLPSRLGSSQTQETQDAASSPPKTQVILRPRPSYRNNNSISTNIDTADASKMIYYYDPSSLTATSVNSPILTLPEIIYDANGNTKKLEEVHNGGKNEVYLEVKPKAVWGDEQFNKWSQQLKSAALSNNGANERGGESDQLIVFGTIATMAILVGMLSAKRLRNKRLLEHCMEGDLEDDWDEGKKNDNAPISSSMDRERVSLLYGEPMGGKKDFGGLHWRGDLEKFDV